MDGMKGFLGLLREWQKIDPEFPLQYALCLAIISEEEGLSVSALADKAGLSMSTVSRIVGALSHSRQKGGQPYGFVRVEISAAERRRKEIYLTDRGRTFMRSVAAYFVSSSSSSSSGRANPPKVSSLKRQA